MALLYPVVVPCSVILSLIAGDCFTGPTINSADLNDIGVAQFHQFFRCLLTPITAAAVLFLIFFSDIYIDCGLSPRVKLSVLEPEIGIYRGFDDGKGTVGNDAGRTVGIVSHFSCSAR